jgi:hypothetical protein
MITQACSIIKLTTPEELVEKAYVIVRAKAVNYAKPPVNRDVLGTDIDPSPVIRFKVEEIIKGNKNISDPLLIKGYLTQYDDFNDKPPPYTYVRPSGQVGSCFADSYKQNASFLLFLNNEYTPYWDPLTPVNEQLHSPPMNDKWLQWVKARVPKNVGSLVASGANRPRLFFF